MRFRKFIKGKSIEGLLTLVLSLLAVVIFDWSIFAQETASQIAFLYGQAAVIYSDSAKPGEKDTYLINLKKGQRCRIDVKWSDAGIEDEDENLPGYTIIFPDGKKLVDPVDGQLQAQQGGDYKIIVSPEGTKTNYRYRIIFTQ